ncbi:MAG: hypothetical protein ACFB0C_08945 [Leptolyngbyaceae cyanobacterium]
MSKPAEDEISSPTVSLAAGVEGADPALAAARLLSLAGAAAHWRQLYGRDGNCSYITLHKRQQAIMPNPRTSVLT